jgi:hypothetical protein
MTDLEMTRLCAEALGLTVGKRCHAARPELGVWTEEHGSYFPIHSDVQSMALIKKFKLALLFDEQGHPPYWRVSDCFDTVEVKGQDLNRVIVECVAKMQAAK